jgi:galactitol-specific phosphotransferase system IIB component
LHSKHTEAASFLADAINAALAEQKQDLWQNISCARIEADNWKGLYEKSQEQLAAEQELNANMASALKQAQIQLAAERERIKVLESGTGLNAVIVTNQHLRKQLADERENYVAQREDWIKEIQELQKQLAAEKDALDTVAKDRDRRAMLLDETVLCLNTVRSFIEHDIQLCAIIDIALAKVKP